MTPPPARIALEAERHRKGDVGSEIHSGPDAEIVGHMGREVEAEAGAADRDSDIKMAENIALLCSERHLSFPVAILRMNRAHKNNPIITVVILRTTPFVLCVMLMG